MGGIVATCDGVFVFSETLLLAPKAQRKSGRVLSVRVGVRIPLGVHSAESSNGRTLHSECKN